MTKGLLVGCSGIALVLALLALLEVDFGGSERNHVIWQARSPDARYVAELHEVITPMHGGPERVEVTWKSKEAFRAVVYAQTFECGPDDNGYQWQWSSSRTLII